MFDGSEAALLLGSTIRLQRKKLGLSQEEVADLSGVSINLLRQIEAGKPTAQLAKVLDLLTAVGLQFVITAGNKGILARIEK